MGQKHSTSQTRDNSDRDSDTNSTDSNESSTNLTGLQKIIDGYYLIISTIICPNLKAKVQNQVGKVKLNCAKSPEEDKEIQCPICLNEKTAADMMTTACDHQFCELCTEGLIKSTKIICPYCRQDLFAYSLKRRVTVWLLEHELE